MGVKRKNHRRIGPPRNRWSARRTLMFRSVTLNHPFFDIPRIRCVVRRKPHFLALYNGQQHIFLKSVIRPYDKWILPAEIKMSSLLGGFPREASIAIYAEQRVRTENLHVPHRPIFF